MLTVFPLLLPLKIGISATEDPKNALNKIELFLQNIYPWWNLNSVADLVSQRTVTKSIFFMYQKAGLVLLKKVPKFMVSKSTSNMTNCRGEYS